MQLFRPYELTSWLKKSLTNLLSTLITVREIHVTYPRDTVVTTAQFRQLDNKLSEQFLVPVPLIRINFKRRMKRKDFYGKGPSKADRGGLCFTLLKTSWLHSIGTVRILGFNTLKLNTSRDREFSLLGLRPSYAHIVHFFCSKC